MRIKFEKGMTPERISETLCKILIDNNIMYGSVNVYIQDYDINMKTQKYSSRDYLVCRPGEESKQRYAEYMADCRRYWLEWEKKRHLSKKNLKLANKKYNTPKAKKKTNKNEKMKEEKV